MEDKCKFCTWLQDDEIYTGCVLPEDEICKADLCAAMEENKLLREALRLMHRSKSKSEFKRLCTQAGIDWAELVREEK